MTVWRDEFAGSSVWRDEMAAVQGTSNADLDQQVVSFDRQLRLKFKFQMLRDLGTKPPAKRWVIKNVIALRESSAWIAPPGGLKSALLCELAFAVASQSDWHGYKSKLGGSVVYFALERADLVRRRLRAYLASRGTEPPPVAVVPGMIDLMNPETVDPICATIRAVQEDTGQPVVLAIFDTFAKLIAAGGGDEDKAKDQGRVFANLQRLKDEIGCHVALIGHTGKDEARGSRGSNAILGDVDLMVTIAGEVVKTATVIKANDAPEGPLFSFKSETHDFGTDEDGDPITVNVVAEHDGEQQSQPSARRWPRGLRLVHEAITAALVDSAIDHRVGGDGPMVRAAPVQAARAVHAERYVSGGDGDREAAERQAWKRNFQKARADGLVSGALVAGQELVWLIS